MEIVAGVGFDAGVLSPGARRETECYVSCGRVDGADQRPGGTEVVAFVAGGVGADPGDGFGDVRLVGEGGAAEGGAAGWC